MKKNILYFLAGVIVTVIIGLVFINYGKPGETTSNEVLVEKVNNQVSFEKKENCMKYFDKYRDYLKEKRESEHESSFFELTDYELFYNSDLDTCIGAYGINGMIDGKDYYNYFIVDYLNGEKNLYNCYTNYSIGIGTDKNCIEEWGIEKEKYKN